jgi:hypothetical protein
MWRLTVKYVGRGELDDVVKLAVGYGPGSGVVLVGTGHSLDDGVRDLEFAFDSEADAVAAGREIIAADERLGPFPPWFDPELRRRQ